jgi:polyisoprenoid-binding protein YceI
MTVQTLLTDPGVAGTWTLEPERSSVRFVSRTLWALVPVNGRFTDVAGEARITPDGRLSGRLVIRADSVRTGIGMRDRHLRAADFFDTRNHPDIVVEVTGLTPDGRLAATLTIRGATQPVPLQASVERRGQGAGAESIGVTARAEIDRTRWGVSGNMLGMMPPNTVLLADSVFVR